MIGLEKLHKIKTRVNLIEDELREKHLGSYIIIRLIPILLIIHSIFGNFAIIKETNDRSLISAMAQLCLIFLAVIWWEIVYLLFPTYRIASIVYGWVFGCALRLILQQISLSVCIISIYIIISSHELLPFDIKNLKEFLLEESSDEEEEQSVVIKEDCQQDYKIDHDFHSVSSWKSDHENNNDIFYTKTTQVNLKSEHKLDIKPIKNRLYLSSKSIKRSEKERRLTGDKEDDLFEDEFYWTKNNRNLVTGKRFMSHKII